MDLNYNKIKRCYLVTLPTSVFGKMEQDGSPPPIAMIPLAMINDAKVVITGDELYVIANDIVEVGKMFPEALDVTVVGIGYDNK